ncbi:conserved hypothetical protein [Desulfatibacillum aliphaticivorans]|uniref:DUF4276 family protein n=1 Tax=Desulfatibacillum aliphaticivorans TaxID=218208 RepID=B8FIC5_DESAL|nr:hypothetical protein [Desulfatibacillum aliphaticivorans]ACL03915.1 conserved hypothetical protein [Desulfatibacillum aliphaticivorans]
MSDPLRVAFAVEGPTDYIMLKEIVGSLLDERDFVPQVLKPEMSDAFRVNPGEDGGWPGVCRWCLQTTEQSEGNFSGHPLFVFHDVLIIQLDADVAGVTYGSGHTPDPFPGENTLPCEAPCPPASATTDRLRSVVLKWIGEDTVPPQTVFCIPSKALEAWALVGLYPDDATVQEGTIECRKKPEAILAGKSKKSKLVARKAKGAGKPMTYRKIVEKYKEAAPEFAANWNRVKEYCTEAVRFEEDFKDVLASLE